MTIAIELTSPGWQHWGGTAVRGSAHLDGRYTSAIELAQRFDAFASDGQWQRFLARCNGSLAVVTRRAGAVWAAVDRVRSIPLFYRLHDGGLHVTDAAVRLLPREGRMTPTPLADAEFVLTGYVTGHETLVGGVYQIPAGELLVFDAAQSREPERRAYYVFEHGDYFRSDTQDLVPRLEDVHQGVFRRLVESVGNRQFVLPLSGGHDSRLVALSLRDLGVRDIVCYSYGLPGNWEASISRELAGYLGLRWEFVPYSADKWRAWAATERFGRYFRGAGNLVSTPHVQDWPAVWELTRERKLAPDAVFVPGHSGDFLAGSHIPPVFAASKMVRRSAFFDVLLRAHYALWDWPRSATPRLRKAFIERIESIVGRVGDVSGARAADLYELWDMKERQAKFICNSVRVYEDFGYEWRLPLFDNELMDFWARVPLSLRFGRKLYFEYERTCQDLPVTPANTDRNAVMRGVVRGITLAGLKPVAVRMRRAWRTLRWRDEYTAGSLGWLAIVDENYFKGTYTGKELFHSYLAMAYRHAALPGDVPNAVQRVIPAMAATTTSDDARIA